MFHLQQISSSAHLHKSHKNASNIWPECRTDCTWTRFLRNHCCVLLTGTSVCISECVCVCWEEPVTCWTRRCPLCCRTECWPAPVSAAECHSRWYSRDNPADTERRDVSHQSWNVFFNKCFHLSFQFTKTLSWYWRLLSQRTFFAFTRLCSSHRCMLFH